MAGVFPMDDVVLEESHNGHDTFSDDDCIEVVQNMNTKKMIKQILIKVEESVYAKGPDFSALNQVLTFETFLKRSFPSPGHYRNPWY